METPLKIGITGASGFVGQVVVEALGRAGHTCIAFSRSPERGVKGCVQTRRFSCEHPTDVSGLDAVVHLAGESIMGLPTAKKLRGILESRREGTRALVEALLAAGPQGPKMLLSASAVGYYGDQGEQILDEDSPAGSGFLGEVAQTWEAEAHRAEQGGVRVAIMRLGVVLGEGGGMVKALEPVFRLGLGATLGSGRQWVSWVDVRDVARLAVFLLENPQARGVFNATSPVPLRNSDFTWGLGRRFHSRAVFRAPGWLLKGAFGPLSGMLLDSQRVLPRRAEALGFEFEHRAVWDKSGL
ncbi:MAG: TIGR01777 family oxidoreductase [Verrucomicrobia bacterium]|nr:TIGR01777 family oxidoreductase [Verrucomicrobiota bacterium]